MFAPCGIYAFFFFLRRKHCVIQTERGYLADANISIIRRTIAKVSEKLIIKFVTIRRIELGFSEGEPLYNTYLKRLNIPHPSGPVGISNGLS